MLSCARARSFFPIVERGIYLDHAATGPLSTRVVEALDRYAQEASRASGFGRSAQAREIERVRERLAVMLGASPAELAFVRSTTQGLGFVAAGLDWRPGDRVLTCDLEYPSNVLPWKHLARRGVETEILVTDGRRLDLDAVEAALRHPAVRMLALSSVAFASGFRQDLVRLGALCRERGVLFCVDAIQSLGCLPVDVRACGIDFLASGGTKWLLSADGCGVFYAAAPVLDRLTPAVVGTRSVRGSDDDPRYPLELREDARRFEESRLNAPGVYALGAAVDLLLEVGIENVACRVLELTDRLLAGLEAQGARIESPREPVARSGIVAFTLAHEPPEQTAARLRQRRILVSVRRGRVRVSPHFYNTSDEIDALLAALR
jgi:cysteine desulfurase / selenocysteine lyase